MGRIGFVSQKAVRRSLKRAFRREAVMLGLEAVADSAGIGSWLGRGARPAGGSRCANSVPVTFAIEAQMNRALWLTIGFIFIAFMARAYAEEILLSCKWLTNDKKFELEITNKYVLKDGYKISRDVVIGHRYIAFSGNELGMKAEYKIDRSTGEIAYVKINADGTSDGGTPESGSCTKTESLPLKF